MKKLGLIVLQAGTLLIFSRLCDFMVHFMHLPIPGSILGLLILFTLLRLGIVRLSWVDLGASWLLAEMLLFFVPATVGIVKFKDLVLHSGLAMVLTIVLSSILVMLGAGWIGQQTSVQTKGDAAP